jgi:hypothetical protein
MLRLTPAQVPSPASLAEVNQFVIPYVGGTQNLTDAGRAGGVVLLLKHDRPRLKNSICVEQRLTTGHRYSYLHSENSFPDFCTPVIWTHPRRGKSFLMN